MKVRTVSVPVQDQEVALQFYTSILGFVKRHDIPVGEHRWLTVVPAGEPEGVEILLEPSPLSFEPAADYQKALYEAGIPWTQFAVDDLESEYKRLKAAQVEFSMEPTNVGSAKIAVFEDTCGNHIQLVQVL